VDFKYAIILAMRFSTQFLRNALRREANTKAQW
jgi:hypothetical protein